ncbi:ABC transporter ATP-binding protein [Methanoregula formicica]|uniref:Cobalamin import ATP-binding protein BtuD n=1 Tax=Methanoregula formicica (strain DSM 22288 / NBRC 105244 / SMSP) TaxID=593750 RepID=L0HDM9_METFS|nr:ABC transporter ATP-binding protein [Methanoregula formicica]AGB01901.1 ABC-type cobalamin/Fe3+-siderophore transport system, ATPase component [Methanoregula formicica SMSP]
MEITLDNVCKDYGEKRVLDDISFSLGKADIVALVGPNGSGKSTLIKIIAGVHSQTSGSIGIDGTDIRKIDPIELAKCIGYVPQHFTYTLYSTVFETVLLGRRQHIKWSVSDEELSRVQHSLEALEMEHMAGSYMDQLSGGERQKVFIARALAQDPKLFLFDEPTSALDIRYQIEVMETMREITWERGAGMIIAVHDLNLAYRYADTVVVLHGGKMAGYGKPQEILTPECIRKVYGVDAFVIENEQGKFLVPFRAGSAP